MANVYVANSTNQNVYVMVSKSGGWQAADIAADIALLCAGIAEIRAGLAVTDLPGTINSLSDLVKVLKWIATLGSGTLATGSRSAEGIKEILDTFKKMSGKIAPGTYTNVRETGFLDYLSPSAIAGAMSAETLELTLISEDGKWVADFTTNQDFSWIVTSRGIVRSKYGSIWQSDYSAGYHSFGLNSLFGDLNQYLSPGDTITSDNGQYELTYQNDGNLVIYRTSNKSALWASGTNGKPAWRTYMQPDGNLVVYQASSQPVWASNTKATQSVFIMQDDGNGVVYDGDNDPLWASNTAQK